MTLLKKLKVVKIDSRKKGDKVQEQRRKLLKKLDMQIQLVTAAIEGSVIAYQSLKDVTNKENGEKNRVGVVRRIRAWYWLTGSGAYQLCVRYGSKRIKLIDDNDAVEAVDLEGVRDAFAVITEAVKAGELDKQIDDAARELRAGFKRG